MNDSPLSFIPIEEALTAPNGVVNHLVDRWWVVHPEKGFAILGKTSPQCNSDRRIIDRLQQSLYR